MNLLKVERGKINCFFVFFLLIMLHCCAHLFSCAYRNVSGPLAAAMPQSVTVTPEEREAIERVSSASFLQ
jgi:hypothetical protein